MASLVVFDMDGVLADAESSWVYVHKHFGVNNDDSLYAYLRGDIDDLEFIRSDIGLWKRKVPSVNEHMIRDILSKVPVMPGALETTRELRARGIKTAIISAGIDLLAERIAAELGIDVYLANGLVTDDRGMLSGEGRLRVRLMDKGDAVDEAGRLVGAGKEEIISVGDSRYDVSMFDRSGKGIAFCPSDDEVRERANVVVEVKDLSEILKHV